MPDPRTPRRLTARFAVVLLALPALALGACGGDDASDDASTVTTAPAAGDDTSDAPDDAANPRALGLVLAGPEGTEVEYEIVGVYQGEEQQPLTQRSTLRDEPFQILLTAFIDSATVTVEVFEGGPVTAQGVWGRMADPENPIGDVDVDEVLVTEDVASGASTTFEIP